MRLARRGLERCAAVVCRSPIAYRVENRGLTLLYVSGPGYTFEWAVIDEHQNVVIVGVVESAMPGPKRRVGIQCTAEVELARPLDGRDVIDARTGERAAGRPGRHIARSSRSAASLMRRASVIRVPPGTTRLVRKKPAPLGVRPLVPSLVAAGIIVLVVVAVVTGEVLATFGLAIFVASPFAFMWGLRMASEGLLAAEREMRQPRSGTIDLRPTASRAGHAAVAVTRRPRGRVDRRRAYTIEIDERAVGSVRVGETVELVLAPGAHRIRLRLDWCSSRTQELALRDGEHQQLECRARRLSPALLFWLTLGCPRYIGLRRIRSA